MPVRREVREGVGWIILDRPPVNALDSRMLQGIIDAVDRLAGDDDTSVLAFKGAGEVFSGGADIREMAGLDPEGAAAFSRLGQRAMRTVAEVAKPTLAAVNGPAVGGGCVLAAFCDLRVAAAGTTFALSEIERGLYPGWDAAGRFVKLVGLGRAAELYFTGASFDAHQALEWGFVNRVATPGRFAGDAQAYARMLVEKSRLALSCAKQVLALGEGEQARELDEDFFGTCICSPWARREMQEFLAHKPGRLPSTTSTIQTSASPPVQGSSGGGGGRVSDEARGEVDMSAIDNIKTRRSVRRWTDEAVSEQDLTTMLECAAQAPSPANWQPWNFIVVRDRELMRRMVAVVEEECGRALSDERLESMRSGIERNRQFFAFFAQAPVVIAALYRPGKFLIARAAEARGASPYDAAREEGFCVPMSVGAAIQNLLLAAHALGYGACWMSGPLFAKAELEQLLGVEAPWELAAIVPLGRPGEVPTARERKVMAEMVEFR